MIWPNFFFIILFRVKCRITGFYVLIVHSPFITVIIQSLYPACQFACPLANLPTCTKLICPPGHLPTCLFVLLTCLLTHLPSRPPSQSPTTESHKRMNKRKLAPLNLRYKNIKWLSTYLCQEDRRKHWYILLEYRWEELQLSELL